MVLKIVARDKDITLGENIIEAKSFIVRLKGLMFQNSFKGFDGMMIVPCNSIHTFFMRMSIHAIFLDKLNRVVKIYNNLKPWRITPIFLKAEKVLEISAEKEILELKEGDQLEVICLNS